VKTIIVLCAIAVVSAAGLVLWRGALSRHGEAATGEIYVSAASSLTDVLEHLAKEFERSHGIRVRADFASSGVLRVKIEAGARVDVFVSASVKDMDRLEDAGYLAEGTRRDLLRNRLACVVPAASNCRIAAPADLLRGEVQRIAIGDPDHAPAGMYATEALLRLKLWDQLRRKVVPCADVRSALAQAELGTVEAAIVYGSDAGVSGRVKVAFTFSPASHAPIIYPVCLLKRAPRPEAARKFLDFLTSASARRVFIEYGFEPITDGVE
jgi:molybdate transport system substrate-binding protein